MDAILKNSNRAEQAGRKGRGLGSERLRAVARRVVQLVKAVTGLRTPAHPAVKQRKRLSPAPRINDKFRTLACLLEDIHDRCARADHRSKLSCWKSTT